MGNQSGEGTRDRVLLRKQELPVSYSDRMSGKRLDRPGLQPALLRRTHGSYADRFAEADGYAYEPRHPVGKSLGHHAGAGTGELGDVALGPPDGEVIDDAASPDDSMDR